jgi:hypothetical protein
MVKASSRGCWKSESQRPEGYHLNPQVETVAGSNRLTRDEMNRQNWHSDSEHPRQSDVGGLLTYIAQAPNSGWPRLAYIPRYSTYAWTAFRAFVLAARRPPAWPLLSGGLARGLDARRCPHVAGGSETDLERPRSGRVNRAPKTTGQPIA